MKINIFILSIVISNFTHAMDWQDKWDASGRDWAEKWTNTMNSIDTFSSEDRIIVLSSALGVNRLGNLGEHQKPIYYRAQSMLLSIQGHAKYYQDKIEKMRTIALENSKKSQEELQAMRDAGQTVIEEMAYESYREDALKTLQFMPSAETVSVLGHFLDDPEGKDGKNVVGRLIENGQDYGPRPRNAEQAAMSIRKLGIEHPPFQAPRPNPHNGLFEGELEAWQSWWSPIRDGKRTYRFIGSKIEYGPDGPASIEVVQRVERDRKRDEERAIGQKKSTSGSEAASPAAFAGKPFLIAGIFTACLLCVAAAWYFLKKRTAA